MIPDSPELYMTKETLERRLERRMSEHYHGMALQRFEPEMDTHSNATRLKRLA